MLSNIASRTRSAEIVIYDDAPRTTPRTPLKGFNCFKFSTPAPVVSTPTPTPTQVVRRSPAPLIRLDADERVDLAVSGFYRTPIIFGFGSEEEVKDFLMGFKSPEHQLIGVFKQYKQFMGVYPPKFQFKT